MDKDKQQPVADPKLAEDIKNCMSEISPILAKYNLDVGARLQGARNGIVAVPEFVRPRKDNTAPQT